MICLLKVNEDLQRMAELAIATARHLVEQEQSWKQARRSELQPIAIAVSHLCRKALRAIVHQDLVLAQSAVDSEEAVRTYRNYALRRIQERSRLGRD